MPSAFSLWATALLVMSLFGSTLSFRAPVDELFKGKSRFEIKGRSTKRDNVCIEDDTLLSFQQYTEDSIPFCSGFLGIPMHTEVSTITTRTTFIDISTTTQTTEAVATVASGTTTVTITQAPVAPMRKREGLIPAAQIIASCTDSVSGQNLSLISKASSACTCLSIPPTTITVSTTETSTKTEEGIDYRFATETTTTVTSGRATVTVTVLPIGPNTTFPAHSTGAPLPTTTLASYTLPPSKYTTVPWSSGMPNLSSMVGPSRDGSITASTIASSVGPPSSMNTTGPMSGSSGLPSPGPIVVPPRTGLPESPTAASSGVPTAPSNFTIPAYTSPSGAPITSTNGSSPSTSGSAPTSTSSNIGCPVQNGSHYTTQGQTFEILCDTNFVGPDYQGLYVPTLYDCINDCAIVNLGFSQNSCYAASYIPNNGVGSDCFFRTLNGSTQPEFDPKATSAILINNTQSTNISASVLPVPSPSASPTNSLNSSYATGPTAYPTASNITSQPYTSTVYANATTSPSALPTDSTNSTNGPSVFPTVSINSSSLPYPPFPTNPSDNRSGMTIPATGGTSSWFPSPTGNSTSCSLWCQTGTTAASGATTTVTDYVTDTVTVTVINDSSAPSLS